MEDKKFLFWLHQRLLEVHDEPFEMDYMNKLRSIIIAMDDKTVTPNTAMKYQFEEAIKNILFR